MSGAWRAYARLVERFPWGSQIAQTGVLVATGDVLAQLVVERKSFRKIESRRVMRFFLMGTFFVAPCVRSWFLVLERAIPLSCCKGSLAKMVLDQGLYAPCYIIMFISTVGVLQGLGKEDIKDKLKEEYVNIMKANYAIWPAAQFLNLYFVPFQHRILMVNFIGLFWRTFLATRTNLEQVGQRGNSSEGVVGCRNNLNLSPSMGKVSLQAQEK